MNDLQLFIAAGLPTITVLVGILLNQRSLTGLENRFTEVGNRFTDVENRFTDVENRFTGLEQRMDRSEQRMDARMDRIEARLDRIEADLREFFRVLGMHEARLDNIEKRRA